MLQSCVVIDLSFGSSEGRADQLRVPRQGGKAGLAIVVQVQQMDYSCIVFDTAPTGHTLRLLQFPATLQKGLSKLMGLRGMLGGMLGQITQLLGGPAGGASNQLFDRLEEMQARAGHYLQKHQPARLCDACTS